MKLLDPLKDYCKAIAERYKKSNKNCYALAYSLHMPDSGFSAPSFEMLFMEPFCECEDCTKARKIIDDIIEKEFVK